MCNLQFDSCKNANRICLHIGKIGEFLSDWHMISWNLEYEFMSWFNLAEWWLIARIDKISFYFNFILKICMKNEKKNKIAYGNSSCFHFENNVLDLFNTSNRRLGTIKMWKMKMLWATHDRFTSHRITSKHNTSLAKRLTKINELN